MTEISKCLLSDMNLQEHPVWMKSNKQIRNIKTEGWIAVPESRRWPPAAVSGARTICSPLEIYVSSLGVLEENMGYISENSFEG